jgi:CBS domain-containing protein
MLAKDLMTRDVITVSPDTPVNEVARLLLRNRISAAPVVDADGTAIGMISEGDLIGRGDTDREARRDWWLTLLAEGEELHPDFMKSLRQPQRMAREVMVAPVIRVTETTDSAEIARILKEYRIKRVPVVHDGRIVGIVSRADLLDAVASPEDHRAQSEKPHGLITDLFATLGSSTRHSEPAPSATPARTQSAADDAVTAAGFRALVAHYRDEKVDRELQAARDATAQRQSKIKELIDLHFSNDGWRALIHRAREAAQHGAKEFMLLRFPNDLCVDNGRAINSLLPDWPKTLRGEAAEIYLCWERDLKPHGFPLVARVLEFPDGKPGDIGLFLVWGS